MTTLDEPSGDIAGMRMAIGLARRAKQEGRAPFGAIVLGPDLSRVRSIWGQGSGSGTLARPLRHSETIAIAEACIFRNGLLDGCTLYSTHEPCAMCCGAIRHSKVSRVVWGSRRRDFPGLFRANRLEAHELLADCGSPPETRACVMLRDCIDLLEGWRPAC